MSDAKVPEEVMDLLLPLDGRFPEPRALEQATVFYLENRTRIDVARLTAAEASRLIAHLASLAGGLHATAVLDESLTMCSGLRRAMAHAGVPSLEQTDPAVWLASTVLVRELRRLAEGRPGNPA